MKRLLKFIGSILFLLFIFGFYFNLVPESVFDWLNDLPSIIQAPLIGVIVFGGWFLLVVSWSVAREEIYPIYRDWKIREDEKKRAKEEAKWEETERMFAEWKKAKERKDDA